MFFSPTARRAAEYLVDPSDVADARIVGVGSEESNHLVQATLGVREFDHPDMAAIMVFIQYMTQLEGPMWRQIRGLGLSYHYK